jgi:hypothetical protein
MENTEIKSGAKVVRNKIVLKNLTKRQKEVLTSVGVIAGGVGLGAGLFTLYSMSEPHIIPGLQTNFGSESSQSGVSNSGNVNALQEDRDESIVLNTKTPILDVQSENIPFSEAFKTAREINGSGSWFTWKGNIYNTYYKEEWQAMSSSEKDEYLTSLHVPNTPEIPIVQEDLVDLSPVEQTQPVVASEVVEVEHPVESAVIFPEINVEPEAFESNPVPETVLTDEFTLDFINMEAREPEVLTDNTQLPEIAEQPVMENLVEGEFISLEDDTDLKHEDIFELHDDVEISIIPEEDLKDLDSVVIDSDQIVEFPWGGPAEIVENETPNEETNVIVEESQEEVQKIELVQPINDSSETEGKPSDGSVEQVEEQLHEVGAEVITNEHLDEPVSAGDANVLEETPWGETIGSTSDEDASSLSEIFQKVEETAGKLISSPDEITEYPWGESVTAEQAVVEPTDAGVIIDEIPLVEVHSQPLASFEDVEEFPWGEQNVHFNPETISAHSETIGELILPESEMEHENVGIIVGDVSDPIFYSQLPPSFSDITEFPWGESILNPPLGQHTGMSDFTDSPLDHNNDHPLTDGAE